MTASEQAGALDDQLRRGYEVFDGLILEERQRSQSQVDAANGNSSGSGIGDGYENGTGGVAGAGTGAGQAQSLPGGVSQGLPGGTQSGVVGAAGRSSGQAETFPPPEDIPSGRDDDVVARQIREAAIREPDPELREALWDEYRRYTGISSRE